MALPYVVKGMCHFFMFGILHFLEHNIFVKNMNVERLYVTGG